jgi:PAS domain S-box-containing protein
MPMTVPEASSISTPPDAQSEAPADSPASAPVAGRSWGALLAQLVDGCCLLTHEGRVVEMDPGAERILGRAHSELRGAALRSAVPELRPVLPQAWGDPAAGAEEDIVFHTGARPVRVLLRPVPEGWVLCFRERAAAVGQQAAQVPSRTEIPFRALVEQSTVGMFVIRHERFVFVNPLLAAIFGFDPGAMVGMSLVELAGEEDRAAVSASLRHGLATGEEVQCSLWARRTDGSAVRLAIHGASVLLGGEPAIVGTLEDVTQDSEAEEALRASERRYRRFFEADLTGDYIASPDGRIQACNPALARLLGYASPAELMQRTIGELMAREEDWTALLHHVRRHGKQEMVEQELRKKDGSVVFVLANVVGECHGTGALLEVRGYVFDISERKRAEEERLLLLQSESAARQAAEVAEWRAGFLGDASKALARSLDFAETQECLARLAVPSLADLCVIDIMSGSSRVERVATACESPGREEPILRLREYPTDLDGPSPSAEVFRTGRPLLVPQITAGVLRRIARSPEHLRILQELDPRSAMILPLRTRSQCFGVLILAATRPNFSYSASDLQLAEELADRGALALEKAQLYADAQAAGEARRRILDVVSHDLCIPLSALSISAEMLRGTLPDEARDDILRLIARSVAGMNRLIQDLLDINSIDTGRLEIVQSWQPPGSILAELEQSMAPLASQSGITLTVEPEDDLPPVFVDRLRVLQVLSNLVGNAMRFTPAGGIVRAQARSSWDGIRFSVSDTGIGIPLEHREIIFQPYWRGGPSVRRKGIGLGLSIAKGIVEAHGGTLWVDSVEGEGSTFYFSLPVGETRDVASSSEAGTERGR